MFLTLSDLLSMTPLTFRSAGHLRKKYIVIYQEASLISARSCQLALNWLICRFAAGAASCHGSLVLLKKTRRYSLSYQRISMRGLEVNLVPVGFICSDSTCFILKDDLHSGGKQPKSSFHQFLL